MCALSLPVFFKKHRLGDWIFAIQVEHNCIKSQTQLMGIVTFPILATLVRYWSCNLLISFASIYVHHFENELQSDYPIKCDGRKSFWNYLGANGIWTVLKYELMYLLERFLHIKFIKVIFLKSNEINQWKLKNSNRKAFLQFSKLLSSFILGIVLL